MCGNTSRLFQSYTIPILHPSNLTHFQPYTLSMIHPSNLTLPIIHSSNPTLFQSYTLSVLNSSNPIFKCFTLPILHKIQLYFLAVPSQLNKLSIYPSHYNSILRIRFTEVAFQSKFSKPYLIFILHIIYYPLLKILKEYSIRHRNSKSQEGNIRKYNRKFPLDLREVADQFIS